MSKFRLRNLIVFPYEVPVSTNILHLYSSASLANLILLKRIFAGGHGIPFSSQM
jgi:hypothetical protein